MTHDSPPIKPPTLFVCITCGQDKTVPETDRDGQKLFQTLVKNNKEPAPLCCRIQPVRCFGGCHHPCVIAFAQNTKITYMYGNIPFGQTTTEEIIAQIRTYARQYTESKTGYVPASEKPELFKHVLIRVPDPRWSSQTGGVTLLQTEPEEISVETAMLSQSFEN